MESFSRLSTSAPQSAGPDTSFAFLKPIMEGVLGYGHSQVGKPLMKKAEGHVLDIYLIGDGLQKLRCGFGTLELGHYLRMAIPSGNNPIWASCPAQRNVPSRTAPLQGTS